MDLHRLRVVEFDTSVSEKENEKYIAEHEEYKQEDWKTSIYGKQDETGDENQSLEDNTSPPGLSKKCVDDKINHPGASKKYLNDTSNPPGTSKKYPNDKICPPGNSEKYLDDTTFTNPAGKIIKDNFTRSKSKRNASKNKPRKRDIKINSSDIGLSKLFQDSAYSHQKKRTFNLRNKNSRVHRKVEDVKEKKEKDEEVHFLFARETPSFIKYCRKRAKNERTTAKKKRDSELPNDIYGFQKSNRSSDQYQYRMSCFNFINTDKIPFKKLRRGLHRKLTPPQPGETSNSACKHHVMRVLNSSYEIDKNPSSSIYYNLGTHPRRSQRKRDNDQDEGFGRERVAKDETVEVSPSSLGPVSISRHDAGTGPSKVELSAVCPRYHAPCVCEECPVLENVTNTSESKQEPTPLPPPPLAPPPLAPPPLAPPPLAPPPLAPEPGAAPAENNGKKKPNKMKETKFITNVPLGFISRLARHIHDFRSKKKPIGEIYIKYVFFGLLIVVWSPCLLAVILAWVVMSPVNLKSILKTDKSKRSCPMNHSLMNRFRKKDPCCEYQRMCFENYLPKNKRSFMTSVTNWYSRTVGSVVNTLTSLLKLKKKAPMCAGSSFLPSHPNTRKRYALFYADNRGWVMKPLRRRNTRSSASTRVVQSMRCEIRPKLGGLRNCPQKFKKGCHCPVHGDDSYPRHTSSAAGDASPLQRTGLWPKCVCWDKYSQGSSIFRGLESRHHRRQQVNIPSTFSYPTSGIAFNPADKTINADNIAHEDLAKYRLGQRKNGTLPFGVVFNHPRGAKHPLITNLKTFRAHKFGLAGKTLNMSTKCTPRLVIKGLQGQLPKCWTKHEAGKAVKKSPGVHRITSFTGDATIMPTKLISTYRQNTMREEALNSPSARNLKSAKKKKKLHTRQKNLIFRNKCVLADIPTRTKQVNTSTYKINYTHKTQNTSKHILYHKVNKPKKAEKAKPDMASKCAKHTPPKKADKYKTDKTRVPTQKHLSPAKIKSSRNKPDSVLNYSFIKKRKQSKQDYKYNPDQIPVATQKQSNTTDITTSTNRNKALNYPWGGKHKQIKQVNKYKPHQIPVATQKQSNKADITTNTNVDIALNRPCGEKRGQFRQANKYKPHQVPVATQKQSNKADITTSTNRNKALNYPWGEKHKQYKLANKPHQVPGAIQKQSNKADITTNTIVDIPLNCPYKEKHEQSKHGYKYQPHQVPNATQIQSRTAADNTTMTNRDIALNCPCGEKHEQSTQANKYKPHQVQVATQKQLSKADITTNTIVDIALNCPCGEKHEQSTQANKYKPHQFHVATQKQLSKADITTNTNVDIPLNCPYEEKHEQSKHSYRYQPHQIPNATQMQWRTAADKTTSTNVGTALNCSCGEKHEQSKHGYKYQPRQIPNATQMQSRTVADNTTMTMTNRDIALNCPCQEKHKQYKHFFKNVPHQIPVAIQMQSRTADNTTMTNRDMALYCPYDEKHEQSTQANKYKPHQVPVATQKQLSKADITTNTNVDILLNCLYEEKHEQSKHGYKYQPHQIPNATQMQSRTAADNTTMTSRDIALNCPCSEKHEQSTQANKYKPHQVPVATQKQSSKADITMNTIVDIALNCPYEEKHEQSKHSYRYQPHQIPSATQMQWRTAADKTTSTNVGTALNCSCGEKHEQSKHGYKYQPRQIPNATQMQSRTVADNTTMTMTNRDIALNYPCEEKHEQYKHFFKNVPHQIPVAIQMQSRTADNTTMTNRDMALYCPYDEKHEQYKHCFKNEPYQISNATQMQSKTIDNTTLTNRDIALCPCGEEHEQYKHCLKKEPHQIPNATQIQSRITDNTTMTNRDLAFSYLGAVNPSTADKKILCISSTVDTISTEDTCLAESAYKYIRETQKHEQSKQAYTYKPYIALNYLSAVKPSPANKDLLCIPSTADKDTMCTQKIRSPEKQDISIQKQASKIETSVNCDNDYEISKTKKIVRPEQTMLPKQAHKYKPYKTTVPIQKQPSTTDIMTSTNRDVALNYLGGVKPSSANKEILCIPSTRDKGTICIKKTISPEYFPKKRDISIQKHASKIETSVYCASDYERSKTKEIVRPEQTVLPKQAYKYEPCKTTVPIQKQLSTANIMKSTNRDIASNCPCGEKHEQSKQGYKYKPHQIPVATRKQSSTSDITTSIFSELALNCPCGEKHEQRKQNYKYRPYKTTVPIQKQRSTANIMTSTNRDVALNYLGGVKPSTANKEILCIPSTGDKDKICIQKTSSSEYFPKKEDISVQKQASKIETSVYCASDYERSKTKVIIRPEKTVFPKKKIDCTSCCTSTSCEKTGSLKQTSSFKKVTDWGWGGDLGGSRKLNCACLYKGTQTIEGLTQENKGEVEAERLKRAITKEMVDCGCGAKPKQQTLAIDCGFANEQNINFLRESFSTNRTILANRTENMPAKQQPSQKPCLVRRTLEISRVSTTPPLSTRQLQTGELLKQFEPHVNNPLFGILSDCRYSLAPQITQISSVQIGSSQFKTAADCRCGVTPQHNMPDKEMEQLATDSKNTDIHETSSAKEPPSQQPRLTQASPHSLQEQPKSFGIASDCLCGTNQPIVAEKSLYNKVTGFKSDTAKETQSKSLAIHPSKNGDMLTPHSYQNGSVDKALSRIEINETGTPALKKSSVIKFPKAPAPSPPQLLTSPPTQPDTDSRKTRVGTEAQAEYPQNLSIQQPKVSGQTSQYNSQTPLTDMQGLKSDSVTAHPRQTRMVTETPPTTLTDIQELPCDCTCDCNSVQRLKSKSPEHLPRAQPDISKIDSLHRSSQSSLRIRKTTLGIDGQPEFSQHLPSVQPDIPKVDNTLSKFPKSLEHLPSKVSQATSPVFGIASDCRCGVTPQQNEPVKQMKQLETDSKKTNTHKTSSAKVPPSQQSKLTQAPSHTLQEPPPKSLPHKQDPVGEQPYFTKVSSTSSERNNLKVDKTRSKFPKSSDHSPPPKSLPHECRCPVETLQDPVGEQPYGTTVNITSSKRNNLKVDKTRSKFPKSPDHSPPPKSLPHECRCPVETLQDPVGEQPYGTKVNTTSSKRNNLKVDKTRSKFPKSSDHSPPPKSLPHECRCPVETLQDPVGEQPYGTTVNITSSKRNNLKVDKTRSKFPKSTDHSPPPKSLPHECRCPVETLQDPVGEQPYFTKVSTTSSKRNNLKVDKTRSKFPKSPDHSPPPKSLPHECRCPVETLQDPVGEQPYGTKVNITSSKRNNLKVDKTRSKFPKSSDHSPPPKSLPHECRCPVETLQDPVGEQPYGTKVSTTSSKRSNVKVDKTRSKFPKSPDHSPLPKSLPHECRCPVETLQDPVGQKPNFTKVSTTSSKRNIVKVDKTRSKFLKSPDHSPPPKSLPHDCRCPVETLQDPVGEQPFFTKVSSTSSERNNLKVDKTLSKFPKSSDHSPPPKSLPHKCRCPVEILQDPVGKQLYFTKVSITSSKRNNLKVDKTQSKFPKSPDHSPPPKSLPHECRCPVETLQDSVGKKTSQRKSVFNRKLKRKSPHECPCSSKHNDFDKRCFESDISVLRNTTRQFSVRSCERTEGTGSVNEPSSRVQYKSKISRLVMSLRYKLFSRKTSKQTKISENLTKKLRSVILSSSQVNPKKVDKSHIRLSRHGLQTKTSQRSTCSPYLSNTSYHLCHCPNDDTEKISLHTRKSKLDDETNRSLFARSHIMSNTSQNPSLAVPSSHSMLHNSCSCVNHQSFSRQCTKKTRYKRKPLLIDKSYSCLRIAKTSQRPSFLSHSSKLKCSCLADNTSSLRMSKLSSHSYPRVSQRIRSQQSKTSEHSSIVMSQTPKDEMSHQILKTLFMRKSHSKSQHHLSHRFRSQFSAYFNRSQETLSDKPSILTQCLSLSHTIIPGMCRCAAKHLGKTTSRQSNARPHPNHQHINQSQKPTSAQKQSSKKFDPQYTSSLNNYQLSPTAIQTMPSQHPPSPEPHKSNRSHLFNPSQSKPLVEKIRSITHKISPNSRKNKQEKPSSNVCAQTALPSKCACWPEKLHQLSKKLSQLSRKSVEKISPSETPPHLLSALPTPPDKTSHKKEKTTSTLGAQTASIIQSKCVCWPEKLHQISKKISQHSRKSVEKTTPSKPPPHLLSAQSTQPDKNYHQTRVGTEGQAENSQHLSIRQLKVSKQSRQPEFFQHFPSLCVQPNIPKVDSLRRSFQSKQLTDKVEKQFEAIPQQHKAGQVIPIISDKGRCAGEQKMKTEYSSSNKLQPNTDLQKLPSIQPLHSRNSHSLPASHPTRKTTLGTNGQPEFSQHLPGVQPDIYNIDYLQRSSQSKQLTAKVEKQFDAIPQQLKAGKVIPILSGKCRCAEEQKVKTERSSNNKLQRIQPLHSSNSHSLSTDNQRFQSPMASHSTRKITLGSNGQPEFSQHLSSAQPDITKIDSLHRSYQSKQLPEKEDKQLDAIPQQSKAGQVIPIISGKCRCAEEQKDKTERSSNNTLQRIQPLHSSNSHSLSTDNQRFQPPTASHSTRKITLGTNGQPEFSQHLSSVQPDITKIDSLHRSYQSKQLPEKEDKQLDAIPQQSKAEQVIPIISGKCRCAEEQKDKTERSSNNTLQRIQPLHSSNSHSLSTDNQRFQPPTASHSTRKITLGTNGQPEFSQHLSSVQPDITKIDSLHRSYQSKQLPEKVDKLLDAIPQQSKAEQVIPIISGKCRCAEEQKDKTDRSSNNKLQRIQPLHSPNSHSLSTDNQRFQPPTASHSTRKITLGTNGQPEFSQHLSSVQPDITKIDSLHRSYQSKQLPEKVDKQLDAIPQQSKAEQVIPIISGKCRCAEEQKDKTERSSNNKLQRIQPLHSPNSHSLSTDNQRFQSPTTSHVTRKSTLGTDKQSEFSRLLTKQSLETPASKLSQPHLSRQADIPYSAPLHNSQPKRKKPCKCRSSKHRNKQQIPNSLHNIAKAQSPGMSHSSSEKFQKSHLISYVYPVTAKKKLLRGEHVIRQRPELSQSSENSQFQPNPQIQVNQQNLQYEKRLSQIPTSLDKPPPELLQQDSPGLGRTGTAEGGVQQPYPDFNRLSKRYPVQQPYPDFNRVSMRYPGHNPSRKQPEPIPGLNRQPSTNRATPPPKYARDPCYTNPANRCAPKSPYDETALRRAYKRRPLRYTPPRQQLPRVVMENKLKENKKKAAAAKKKKAKRSRNKTFFQCLRDLINQTEREAWPTDVECHPMYINALKHRPCFFIYKLCPSMYPAFLNFYKYQQYIGQIFVYLLTLCFWSPLLLCGYFCCDVMCKS